MSLEHFVDSDLGPYPEILVLGSVQEDVVGVLWSYVSGIVSVFSHPRVHTGVSVYYRQLVVVEPAVFHGQGEERLVVLLDVRVVAFVAIRWDLLGCEAHDVMWRATDTFLGQVEGHHNISINKRILSPIRYIISFQQVVLKNGHDNIPGPGIGSCGYTVMLGTLRLQPDVHIVKMDEFLSFSVNFVPIYILFLGKWVISHF